MGFSFLCDREEFLFQMNRVWNVESFETVKLQHSNSCESSLVSVTHAAGEDVGITVLWTLGITQPGTSQAMWSFVAEDKDLPPRNRNIAQNRLL